MSKRVLSVGQCGVDHPALSRFLANNFSADVEPADTGEEALRELRSGNYDLVLVNRKLDRDGSDGIELIRRLKSNGGNSEVPVMLVSNHPEYQEQAVAAGAEPGFGKAELSDPRVVERLRQFLE